MKAWSSCLAVALLTSAASANAHDTWLRARETFIAPGHAVRLDMTSGMHFPVLDYAIAPERIARAEMRLGGEVSKLAITKPGGKSLVLGATLPRTGVAAIAVELVPRRLTLDEAHVEEYLKEIGATESIGPLWAREPNPRRWRETYRKQAKTFVRAGEPTGEPSWREPLGLALELIPDADPTRLRVGDALRLQLRKQGAPLAGVVIGADHSTLPQRRLVTTDADGWARFVFDHAGPWLLAATELRRRADGGWESDFTTLTVEIAAVQAQ